MLVKGATAAIIPTDAAIKSSYSPYPTYKSIVIWMYTSKVDQRTRGK